MASRQVTDRMSPREFKAGLLALCDRSQAAILRDETIARHLAAAYIDADPDAQADCTRMLRDDLARLDAATGGRGDG